MIKHGQDEENLKKVSAEVLFDDETKNGFDVKS